MHFKDNNLSSLLPWYINHSLDEAERRRVEHGLKASPLLQAELTWMRRLRQQIQISPARRRLPAWDAGLDRLMQMIETKD
ncbi:MAG: hypothetical protein HYS18_04060 [Burkholderiales bacterium]|nr:hypothetical protein [Burkholderiales bacterium]